MTPDVVDADFNGDVKSFFVAGFPYEHALMPPDPYAQGVVDLRLKLDVRCASAVHVQVHHALTATAPGVTAGFGLASTGVATEAPEAIDLSWSIDGGEGMNLGGRVDRALIGLRVPHLDVTVGRQPISFGNGFMFTPLDLVNPFHPAVIDQEYKPGVDAARIDLTSGVSTQATLAAAYAGSWDLDGLVAAAYGQATFGVWDVGAFAGLVHADVVLGATTVGSVGPLGLRADAAFTLPDPRPSAAEADPFVRAVAGVDWRPHEDWFVSGELYVQTLGATDADEYLTQALDPRYARGELWALGRYYAGTSVSWQTTPTLGASFAVLANLQDPSALLLPGLRWSVADEAEVAAGAFFGLGKRPGLTIESELGLVPTTVYVQMRTYF